MYYDNPPHELYTINPHFSVDQCTCVFAVDRNYLHYLSVAIESIILNSNNSHKYELIILYSDLEDYERRFLINQTNNYNYIYLSFYKMDSLIKKFNINEWFSSSHVSTAAYYRLFVGKIFHSFKKILYLDCDLIVNKDIFELFSLNLQGKAIGACRDLISITKYEEEYKSYMLKTFEFEEFNQYFNSGVLLIDIGMYNKIDFNLVIKLINKNNKYFHDQNILNVIFKNNYFNIDYSWNVLWYPDENFIKNKLQEDNEILSLYRAYDLFPNIVHYCSKIKPWYFCDKNFADLWWKYAKLTPFYELLLDNYIYNSHLLKSRLKYKVFKYKLLSHILFGSKRKYYIEKLKKYSKSFS